MKNFKAKILKKLGQVVWLGIITFVLSLIAGTTLYVFAVFTEPNAAPSASDQDFAQNILGANDANNEFDSSLVTASSTGSIIERLEYIGGKVAYMDEAYGRGWMASTTGDNATTSLTKAACEDASDWQWFEDGNGDGDYDDPEDGICVQTANLGSDSCWNGDCSTSGYENSYIAAYSCTGSFPNGYVVTGEGNYAGYLSGGGADTEYNDGDCALCKADCRDGRKDLPDQGSWTTHNNADSGGVQGPLTPEVLKNWKGTRLPTFNDFFGFCGATTDDDDNTPGDSAYHSSGASSDKTIGRYGQNVGRGANGAPDDEYMDIANMGSYEWLSEQNHCNNARIAGNNACSGSSYYGVYDARRSRAVFRP